MYVSTIARRVGKAFGVALLCTVTFQAGAVESDIPLGNSTIVLGAAEYADELAVTALAEPMLEKLGYNVKVVYTSVGLWFSGIALGDIDLGLNAWLPVTHGKYWKKYEDKLVDLGTVYKPTSEGWAVPAYIPKSELDSIEDLKQASVKKKLDSRITGIGPGAGLMRLSRSAMKKYDLSGYGYQLVASSEPAMTAALSHAIKNKDWIVVTSWSPHWMWARWDLRYLKDPKHVVSLSGRVDAVAGLDFTKRFPRAATFVKHFKLSVMDVETVMNNADKFAEAGMDDDEAYSKAAQTFFDKHPDKVKQWLQTSNVSS